MHSRYCVDIPNAKIIGGHTEGEVLKLEALSLLGDVDSRSGIIVSEDVKAVDNQVKNRILVVRKFRGSTVGAYVLYSLCRRGLAPRAIVSIEPDPVVVAGIVLCDIVGVFRVPENIIELIESGDRVEIEPLGSGVRMCVVRRSL